MRDLKRSFLCATAALALAACTETSAPVIAEALEFRELGVALDACEPIPTFRVVATRGSNVATEFNEAVTISIVSGTGVAGSVLSGTKTVQAVAGIATFEGIEINASGTGYRLSATSPSLAIATPTFDVVPGGAYQLAFTAAPVFVSTNLNLPPVRVAVRDACGGPIPGSTLPITVALNANSASAVLGGTTTVNAINGVATFLDLTVNKPGAGLTLGATSSGLATATTAAFTIAGTP
jgi:FlaG/FlaF family flagellin (archaellin)